MKDSSGCLQTSEQGEWEIIMPFESGVMEFKDISFRIILWQMLAGTRGGYTRGFILNMLADKSYNTNQLAQALNIDYQTIIHQFQSNIGKN